MKDSSKRQKTSHDEKEEKMAATIVNDKSWIGGKEDKSTKASTKEFVWAELGTN